MLNPPEIVPPDTGSNEPDRYTKSAPDFTGDSAPERIFFINLYFFRYGTKDKAHGATVLLSLLLLAVILIVMAIGLHSGTSEWLDRVFTWLGSAFLFVAGVAVGRSGPEKDGEQ